ncbi:MAG: hypothetical protein PHU88_07385 [candidate division Zixibacteria bacterium]|nr:hypothetical protein [candidate division Zixibacteria bacterium]
MMVAFLFSCAGDEADPEKGDEKRISRKAEIMMDKRYIQPYANAQLNAFCPATLQAEGELAGKITFNETEIPGGTQFLYLLDNRRAVVDFGLALFCVDLERQKTLNFYRKSSNAFIRAAEGPWFFYVSSFRLVRAEFDRVNVNDDGVFVPGLGEFSFLACFSPEEETFIAGIHNLGAPDQPVPSFEVYRKKYDALDYIWRLEIPGGVLTPPIDRTGQVILAASNIVSVVNNEGKKKKIIGGDFEVLSASVGPDDQLYMVLLFEDGKKLVAYDLFGEKKWACNIDLEELVQPPVVNDLATVYLVEKNGLTAYAEAKNLWHYPLLSGHPAVTAINDGMVVIADGSRLVCLDELGEERWVYVDKEGDNFVSPPVIDDRGQVLAASDKKIIILK